MSGEKPARRLGGMTVGKQKPRAAPGMGDVKAAEYRQMVEIRDAARRARERRELLQRKGGRYA